MSDDFDPTPLLGGWVDDPGRHLVASSMPWGRLQDAAPDLAGDTDGRKNIMLHMAFIDVLGAFPEYPAQQIGDCTGVSGAEATDQTQCIEIALKGDAEEFKHISSEALYGMARELAGMLRGGDGCYGSAIAKALTEGGVVPREVAGAYSGQRAKEWGRRGVPAEIKQAAAQHKLGAAALVVTLEELDAGLNNGYCGQVCSSQGFTMTRDANGMCQPKGRWDHAMKIMARRFRNNRREYLIGQNWGPNVPSGPLVDNQPNFSFWIDEDVMARMLAARDSYLYSGLNGFPRRDLPSGWSYRNMF